MEVLYVVLILIGIIIVRAAIVVLKDMLTLKGITKALNEEEKNGFQVSRVIEDGTCLLAVDETNHEWIFRPDYPKRLCRFKYEDLLHFSVTETGFLGKSTELQGEPGGEREVELRIDVNNTQFPILSHTFFKRQIHLNGRIERRSDTEKISIRNRLNDMKSALTAIMNANRANVR